jgi:hypothetical protein
MSGNEGILSLGSGVSRESGKIKGGPAGEGEMGEGGETWMGKTGGNYITLDLSNSSKRNRQGQ